MYKEKLEPILNDLENKEITIAGGSTVGIMLATVNSLIKYIANLTFGKKGYEDVQPKIEEILQSAENLKEESLNVIDKDKEIVEEILNKYKTRNQFKEDYVKACKNGVEFCIKVVILSLDTLKLSCEISKVGNKMLASDFKICKYYAFASIQSAIVNVNINLDSIEDFKYKRCYMEKCNTLLEEAKKYIEDL